MLTDFLKRFKYRKGIAELFGSDIREGAVGDCHDFAWTVLIIVEGGKWQAIKAQLTGRAVLWRVKSPVNGIIPRHVALWHREHGWIDSTHKRKWRDTPAPHQKMWPIWVERLAFVALIWWNWPFIEAIARSLIG